MAIRDDRGKFVKGNPGGPGRKPRATEEEYLTALVDCCSLASWRKIAKRAVADAEKGDRHARQWLSDYILGKPVQRQQVDVNGSNVLSPETVAAILDVALKADAPEPTIIDDDAINRLLHEHAAAQGAGAESPGVAGDGESEEESCKKPRGED